MREAMLTILAPLILLSTPGTAAPGDPPEGRAFELEEGRVFRFSGWSMYLMRGVQVVAEEEPPAGLRGSPEFVAETPLYGAIPLGDPDAAGAEGERLLFALDKRKPDGRRYDRLYLDLDRDGDLADEERRRTSKAFELEFDLGEGYGMRATELKPRVRSSRDGPTTVSLYATTVRHGSIEIGDAELEVVLAQGPHLGGRYDLPDCHLSFLPRPATRMGNHRLGSGLHIDGEYYVFSATPDGSRFTVTPYTGDLGVFRVGAGGRDVESVAASGFLFGDFEAPIGGGDWEEWPEPAPECRIPVGSYRVYLLTARFGTLAVDVSHDPFAGGESGGVGDPPIEIRTDRPYVLDLSERPEIRFLTPESEERFERGDEVDVEALLTYPKQGLMIRDIERWREGKRADTWVRRTSLAPKVTVLDSSGKVCAKGKMPFG